MKGVEIIIDGKRVGIVRDHGSGPISHCDGRCDKAWGISERPKVHLDPVEYDDYAFLADGELGTAPASSWWEGGQGKPIDDVDPHLNWLNKWCIRQCERYDETARGQPVVITDAGLSKRRCNMRKDYVEGMPIFPAPE